MALIAAVLPDCVNATTIMLINFLFCKFKITKSDKSF